MTKQFNTLRQGLQSTERELTVIQTQKHIMEAEIASKDRVLEHKNGDMLQDFVHDFSFEKSGS